MEKTALCRILRRRLKNVKRATENAEKNLADSLAWHQVYHEALLLQSHLYRVSKGTQELIVQDWEEDNREKILYLDPHLEPKQELARRFKRSKKLRAGIPHWQRVRDEAHAQYTRYAALMLRLENATSPEELHAIQEQISIQEPAAKPPPHLRPSALPYKEFISEKGLKIWVGKNARANDQLTFHHAHGLDWWLHVRDVPGSHVVLKVPKGEEPDEASLKDAIQLALAHSKAPQEGEVCITQCKYVARLGKTPGKVQVSKQRTVYAKKDPIRLQQLKARR